MTPRSGWRARIARLPGFRSVPAVAVGLALAGCAESPEPRAPMEAFHADLVEILARVPVPGLSVVVAREGEPLWARGYGVADAATGREATATTPYRIGSITKPMAAAVVLRLASEGRLALDAPVGRYLEAPPSWADSVTVRHVLSHTSEGPRPGERFTYSGRYNVLSLVAERVAGRPFPRLLDSLVFAPAGMTASIPVSWHDSAGYPAASLAPPHTPDGEVGPAGDMPDATTGGNGVVSTAPDLARFAHSFARGAIVDPAMVASAWTPAAVGDGTGPYGLGWFVEETPVGRLVWHGGQWPGYSGLLLHVPEEGLTLAVLANAWGVSHPYYQIGTGTVLYGAVAASFLRHMVLGEGGEDVQEMPWGAHPDSLARIGTALPPPLDYFWGAELFGRGLLHREAGQEARGDSLMAAAVACCPRALEASEDLGLLFHLGRSADPTLGRIGREAGERRLARHPDDLVTRFNLAVAYLRGGEGTRATPLLEALLDDPEAPGWLLGWAAYLRAEQLAVTDPDRARQLLRGVVDRGIDESGLLGDARALLDELGG